MSFQFLAPIDGETLPLVRAFRRRLSARGFHRLNCVRCIDHFGARDKFIEPDCDQVGGLIDVPEAFSR